jgi:AdoMet-dependent heme synthase
MNPLPPGPLSRRLRRLLGAATGRVLTGPQIVSLEVTHLCNLRCSFCESHGRLQEAPITAHREYVGGRVTMDLEAIRRLVVDLAAAGAGIVELSGKGDPIAHPQLTEIVKFVRDAGLRCTLVTNGTLASPDLARTLVERELDRLSVSLNAGCRETFLRSSGRDLWDRAVGFLGEVRDERRRQGRTNPWIRITHVVTKENLADMDGMVDICGRLQANEVSFYMMGELPETRSIQLDEADVAYITSGTAAWSRRLDEMRVEHALPAFAQELAMRVRGGSAPDNPLQRTLPCYGGWNYCSIAPDGAVTPCCHCEKTDLGNLSEERFGDIWRGARYDAFRRACLRMPRTGQGICRECYTTCNLAGDNLRIHNRLHPFSRKP